MSQQEAAQHRGIVAVYYSLSSGCNRVYKTKTVTSAENKLQG